jgi:hypothetical protein
MLRSPRRLYCSSLARWLLSARVRPQARSNLLSLLLSLLSLTTLWITARIKLPKHLLSVAQSIHHMQRFIDIEEAIVLNRHAVRRCVSCVHLLRPQALRLQMAILGLKSARAHVWQVQGC